MAETVLIVEDEPEFAALVELWVGQAGYRHGHGPDRDRGLAPVLRRAPGPRHPRRRAPRPRWLAAPGAPPRVQPRPDHHGHRAWFRSREDPRPEARRGRLHHEAAVVPGAHRARRGRPSPGRDERAGATASAAPSRPRRRPRRPPSPPARRRGRPDADRVPSPCAPRRACRPARDAPTDPRRRVGRRIRPRRPPAPDDRAEPAPQARGRGSGRALHRDRVRSRLPPDRTAGVRRRGEADRSQAQ